MIFKDDLSAELVRELFDCDPKSGALYWRARSNSRVKAGALAGHFQPRTGYICVTIKGQKYRAHRLIWLHVYGRWPDGELDHINNNRIDNRISNLRPATPSQNKWNLTRPSHNTSGQKGISWDKRSNKWLVCLQKHGIRKHIGLFSCMEDAVLARDAAVNKWHGEFGKT